LSPSSPSTARKVRKINYNKNREILFEEKGKGKNTIKMVDEIKNKVTALEADMRKMLLGKAEGKIPNLELPKFSGRLDAKDFSEFLSDFYKVGNLFCWKESRCCQVLPVCLNGEALAVYESLPDATKKNWKLLVTELMKRLMRTNEPYLHMNILQNRSQGERESITEFGNAIRNLVKRAFPEDPNPAVGGQGNNAIYFSDEQRKTMEIVYFMNGVKTSIKAQLLRNDKPLSLEEAMEMAIREQNIQDEIMQSQIRDGKLFSEIAAPVNLAEDREISQNYTEDYEQNLPHYQRSQNFRQNYSYNGRNFRTNYKNYGNRRNFGQQGSSHESWEPDIQYGNNNPEW
jgi:hypothetical protein